MEKRQRMESHGDRSGLARELVTYCTVGILPFIAAILVFVFVSFRDGLYMMASIIALVAYATVRLGFVVGLRGREWRVVLALFFAGYVGSFAYLLRRAYLFHLDPPDAREGSGPGHHQKGESVVLDWSQPHGHGGSD